MGVKIGFTENRWTGFDGYITSGKFDLTGALTKGGSLKARFSGEIDGSELFVDHHYQNRKNFALEPRQDDDGSVRAFISA